MKLKLYYFFYKSTLSISLGVSIILSLSITESLNSLYKEQFDFLPIFIQSFVFAGTALSLFYKEIAEANEYYFYYNQGVSKLELIIGTFLANFIIGMSINFLA